jgi:hypothetical protein
MRPLILTKKDLEAALDRLTLRMTVRFGVMLSRAWVRSRPC